MQAWAQTEAYFNFLSGPFIKNELGLTVPADGKRTMLTAPFSYNGVTITTDATASIYCDDDEGDLCLFIPKKTSYTIAVEEGNVINRVEFIRWTHNYTNRTSVDVGDYVDISDEVAAKYNFAGNNINKCGLWTGSAQQITVTNTNASNALCYDAIVVYYEPSGKTAINGINADNVKATRYYNLQGVESAVPFQGVNIVVKEMTDGSKVATKVVK